MLSEKPFLSIIILIATNLALLIVANLISLVIPLINPFFNQIIQIIIKFILLAILVFFLLPLVYKLPRKYYSYQEFLKGINLQFQPPYLRIIFVTIGCYAIFVLCELIGSFIYGQYVFDISRVVPPLSYNILDVNAGIFEEIMFRGIIFTLLLNHFSERRSLLYSSLLFGVVHYANLLNGFSYEVFIYTTAQATWAIGMGFLWGYLVLKTNSIFPAIILHYLSNAFDSLWLYIPSVSIEIRLIYMLLFAKFIPIIISILLIRYLAKNKEKVKLSSSTTATCQAVL